MHHAADLATSLGATDDLPAETASDPMAQMMAGLGKMMAPAMKVRIDDTSTGNHNVMIVMRFVLFALSSTYSRSAWVMLQEWSFAVSC